MCIYLLYVLNICYLYSKAKAYIYVVAQVKMVQYYCDRLLQISTSTSFRFATKFEVITVAYMSEVNVQ